MRLSQEAAERVRKGLQRSWANGTHRRMQQARPLQAEDVRKRQLHDARGKLLFTGRFLDGTPFTVTRSLRGRTDQFDVNVDGVAVFTGRGSLCFDEIHKMSLATQNCLAEAAGDSEAL